MARHPLLLAIVSIVAAAPLAAQKPPPVLRPTTQPQTRPQPSAPATGGKVFRPATGASPGAAPAGPPAAPVTPQAARPGAAPAAAAPAPAAAAFTAGLAIPPYAGATPDAVLDYAARFGHMLDSAIVMLVDVFRNTSGQPMDGASSPAALSQRERDRWARCRNLYWDLTTFGAAMEPMTRALPADPALQRAAEELDSAFVENQAVANCDNVASMIAAPDRWTPWQEQYQAAAQQFYRDFYNEVRGVHERDRAFVNVLNQLLPAARRIQVPAGLPRNPPYAGAAPS